MTAGPSGVNETLSERCFRPFASKTRELSVLGACPSIGADCVTSDMGRETPPVSSQRCFRCSLTKLISSLTLGGILMSGAIPVSSNRSVGSIDLLVVA